MKLENTYSTLPKTFYSFQRPQKVRKAETVLFNSDLAKTLGLEAWTTQPEKVAAYLSGNEILENTTPIAQAYAGHQFGHFTMLGDGRAVLLGEKITLQGQRLDIQLKGSGQTPYSRRGDGRATLYSMLREFLISEAMHHLGIPSSRSLAVVSTGEQVQREMVQQGAVLTRISKSHIRVGTFEYARNFGTVEDLEQLTKYTIQRHYPELIHSEKPAVELLRAVMNQQIDLVIHWMRVGFIHGVMNTDNMSIAGETFDYGPCAFMNAYDPKTVFSSIDSNGRYAFGNQPHILRWNIIAFANAIIPLFSDKKEEVIALAQSVVDDLMPTFNKRWYEMMFKKLGLLKAEKNHKDLVERLLSLMQKHAADYTQMFQALQLDKSLDEPLYQQEEFKQWKADWSTAIQNVGSTENAMALMNQVNPKVIPRNHWVEDALQAAVEGDMSSFNDLLKMLSKPYEPKADAQIFESVPKSFDLEYQTFCGT